MLTEKIEKITFLLGLIHNYVIVTYDDREKERLARNGQLMEAEELLVTKLRNLNSVLIMQGKLTIDISREVFNELSLVTKFVEDDMRFISPTDIKAKILTTLREIQ